MKNNKLLDCSNIEIYILVIMGFISGSLCGYQIGDYNGYRDGYENGVENCIDEIKKVDVLDIFIINHSFSVWSRNGALIPSTDPNIMQLNHLIKIFNHTEGWTHYVYRVDDKYYINGEEVFSERPDSFDKLLIPEGVLTYCGGDEA